MASWKRLLSSGDNISELNNNSGFTANTGDITGVTAGTGMSGGGTSGTVTLNCSITNNNQLTNGAGYTTNTGTTTASNSQTFTNKGGNISQWTNDSGYTTNAGDITAVTAGTGLTGGGSSGGVTLTLDIPNDTITTGMLRDEIVNGGHIIDDSIDSQHYADASIDSVHLADDAVTKAKVADSTVDEARLQISNAGTNGQFLSRQSGNTGGMTWTNSAGNFIVSSSTSPTLQVINNSGNNSSLAIQLIDQGQDMFQVGAAGGVKCQTFGVGTAYSGTTGEIRATNEITAYYSDDRLKDKIGPIKKALDKVSKIEGFYYTPNDVAQELGFEPKENVGLSAQSVRKVLPHAVVPAPIDDKYLTIKYEKVIPLLVNAINELSERVEYLEAKV